MKGDIIMSCCFPAIIGFQYLIHSFLIDQVEGKTCSVWVLLFDTFNAMVIFVLLVALTILGADLLANAWPVISCLTSFTFIISCYIYPILSKTLSCPYNFKEITVCILVSSDR